MNRRRQYQRLGAALLSFGLALLMWFYVVGQKEKEWSYSIPVSVTVGGSKEDLSGQVQPEKVAVLLKGPRRILDQLDENRMVAKLTMAENQPGIYTRALLSNMVNNVPPDVEVMRIDPPEVVIEVKTNLIRRLRVVPRMITRDTAWVLVGDPVVDPPQVQVRGIQSVISGLTEVTTLPLPIAGGAGKHTVEAEFSLPAGITTYPALVMVTYELGAAGDTRP